MQHPVCSVPVEAGNPATTRLVRGVHCMHALSLNGTLATGHVDQAQSFPNGFTATTALKPDAPLYGFRPGVLAEDARHFLSLFPGTTAYAVKTNPDERVLKTLVAAGVTAFDVASPAECEAVIRVKPDAKLYYMHPVKAMGDIRLALTRYGVRHFALDHEDELAKILREARSHAVPIEELTLFVRLQSRSMAAYDLSKKFGAAPGYGVELVRRIHRIGAKCALTFHVGSQVEETEAYTRAIKTAAWVRARAGVPIVALDIGGGFPAPYGDDGSHSENTRLDAVMGRITEALEDYGFDDTTLIAEPGRVIVARSLSVIARVLLRKNQRLYINDGIWSSLSDAWTARLTLPVMHIPDTSRPRKRQGSAPKAFKIYGATCDSVDILQKPFWLPGDIQAGDWIEIGHIGAYSLSLRTSFNGFYPDDFVILHQPFRAGPHAAMLAAE